MQQEPITATQKNKIRTYLEDYVLSQKMLALDKYEREYIESEGASAGAPKEIPLARARMYSVRHFILALPNGDEKLFLYYHYVKGDTVPRCAELLGISERSCFRLKNRALALAYHKLFRQ